MNTNIKHIFSVIENLQNYLISIGDEHCSKKIESCFLEPTKTGLFEKLPAEEQTKIIHGGIYQMLFGRGDALRNHLESGKLSKHVVNEFNKFAWQYYLTLNLPDESKKKYREGLSKLPKTL